MENLNDILLFIEVAKRKSFSEAAKVLNMQKSTLSRRLSELEHSLGVTLLRRTTRQVALTSEGEKYFNACMGHIDSLMQSKKVFEKSRNEINGEIKLTAPIVLGQSLLPQLVSEFLKKYPEIRFNLHLDDRTVDLVGEKFDLAIRAGALKDSNFKSKRLGQNRFMLMASKKYLKGKRAISHPRDLINEQAIMFVRPAGDFPWILTNNESKIKFEPLFKVRVNHLETVKSLCLQGMGFALLPLFLCQSELNSGELEIVCPDWCGDRSPVTLVYPPEEFPRKSVTTFIEFLVQKLSPILNEN